MTTEEVKRKLAAILSADVKGYSRLMGEDEKGTVRTLNAYKEAMAGLIQHHHGRVVDAPGDNVLAEFASVVDAVECAVEIQKELKTRNAELPENRKMEFRIGVNLGDVIEDGEKILGDGVNIAARLESLSDAGGICISGTAYDQVENKLELGYQYLGEQTVKNIAKPVRVYRARIESEAAPPKLGEEKKSGRKWFSWPVLAGVVVIVVIGAVALWQFALRPSPPSMEVASKEKMAFPLPDKPSIAVLPFVNMSEDPKQEYFSDGITEEIITALSKIPRIFVIARNSTFTYKGKAVKVKQVAEELGIRYVLEGSVRKAGDKVRISAQLIDALSGNHLWAERYDRDLKDIFALQDEITLKITTALQVKLTTGEQARLMAKGTTNLEAYLKAMQCRELGQRMTKEGNVAARKLAEEIIALDPKYPFGYLALALSHHMDIVVGLSESPSQSADRGIELAKKAISLDNSYSFAYSALGIFYVMYKRDYEMAITQAERAVALDPNSAENLVLLTYVLCHAGRPEEAIPLIEGAERLNPIPLPLQLVAMGLAYRLTGRYEKAIEADKGAIRAEPNNQLAHVDLIASYIALGREKEARAEASELLRINPNFSVDLYMKRRPYKNQTENDRLVDALYKAGLK
jgi:adenylate cyclase